MALSPYDAWKAKKQNSQTRSVQDRSSPLPPCTAPQGLPLMSRNYNSASSGPAQFLANHLSGFTI